MANTNSLSLVASSSQYAYITDTAQTGLDITGDMTVEGWVKFTSQPATDTRETILSKWDSSDRSYIFSYRDITSVTYLDLFISATSTGGGVVSIAYSFTNSIWYHVAVVYTASTGTAEFYVNGASIGTASGLDTSIYNSTAPFLIGAYSSTATDFFDGLVDEVRVWNDIRTATEISDNYQKELLGTETGLVGYWQLDNDYLDMTANNNDLTAVNSPVFSTDVPFTGITTTNAPFFGCAF